MSVILAAIFLVIASVSQSEAAVANCDAVPIEKWGGRSLNRSIDLAKPVRIAVVMDTTVPQCSTDIECEESARLIRTIQKIYGEVDIGVSFLIGGNGKVYEGSGWKVGAHTLGWNNVTIGIAFIGKFRDKLPTPQALKAAQDFLACSVNNKNLDERYHLVGQCQLGYSSSPGAPLQSYIETWPHWLSDISKIWD